ncbi:Tyrosine-protein kinase TXK [Leucoagaricus sp. SymC.cos]|nr:Tyrosine-protein kinase TXK [Leucoagaricus sp. SymC.cos]
MRNPKADPCEWDNGQGKSKVAMLTEELVTLRARVIELENPGLTTPSVTLHDPYGGYKEKSHSPPLPEPPHRGPSSPFSPTSTTSSLPSGRHWNNFVALEAMTPSTGSSFSPSRQLISISPASSTEEPPHALIPFLIETFLPHATEFGFFLDILSFHRSALLTQHPFGHPLRPTPALLTAVYLWGAHLSHPRPHSQVDEHALLVRALHHVVTDTLGNHPRRILHTIQAEVLLASYYFRTARFLEAKVRLGSAVALVLSTQMHRLRSQHYPVLSPLGVSNDMPVFPPGPHTSVEEGEQINGFWAVFSLHKMISFALDPAGGVCGALEAPGLQIDTPWPFDSHDYRNGCLTAEIQGSNTVKRFLAGYYSTPNRNDTSLNALLAKASILCRKATYLTGQWTPNMGPRETEAFLHKLDRCNWDTGQSQSRVTSEDDVATLQPNVIGPDNLQALTSSSEPLRYLKKPLHFLPFCEHPFRGRQSPFSPTPAMSNLLSFRRWNCFSALEHIGAYPSSQSLMHISPGSNDKGSSHSVTCAPFPSSTPVSPYFTPRVTYQTDDNDPATQPEEALSRQGTTDEVAHQFEKNQGKSSNLENVLAKLSEILTSREKRKHLQAVQNHTAQSLIDFLHAVLSLPDLPGSAPHWLRECSLVVLRKLCENSDLYPQCYILKGIRVFSHEGWALRIRQKSDVNGILKVCLDIASWFSLIDPFLALQLYVREAVLWNQLSHPNILPFYGVCYLDKTQERICLVSPWMENGNIVSYLAKNLHVARVPLIHDVASGLHYLHDSNVVHGDLKGGNVLVNTTGRACIADFGVSRIAINPLLNITLTAASAGYTTRWAAPELLIDNSLSTRASDIWAFGCVCFEILTGLLPFRNCSTDGQIVLKLFQGCAPAQPAESGGLGSPLDDINEAMSQLLAHCWHRDPDSRLSSAQILAELESHEHSGLLRRGEAEPPIEPSTPQSLEFLRGYSAMEFDLDEVQAILEGFAGPVDGD